MGRQLVLLDGDDEWELDEATKALGLRNVAKARAALAAARREAAAHRPSHAA